MAWNVKESEQSVNRQLVFRRKEMASQIVTTKKGSGQIFVLNSQILKQCGTWCFSVHPEPASLDFPEAPL